MVNLTKEDVLKLARLARLKLTADEVEKYTKEITNIIKYVEILKTADLKSVEPTNQVTGLVNVMRADKVIDYGVSRDELLKNVPEIEDGLIKVKRML